MNKKERARLATGQFFLNPYRQSGCGFGKDVKMEWLEVYRQENGLWGYAVWDHSYSDSFPAAHGGGYLTALDAMREATAVKRERFERYHMAP